MTLQLGKFEVDRVQANTFHLFSCQNVFSEKSYELLQNAFNDVDWVKKETTFYSQYESFVKPSHKNALTQLFDPAFFFPFKQKLEKLLGISLQNHITLAAHKLITSDEIGIHNDYANPEFGYENYRFIFQFARPNQLVSGGEIGFVASRFNKEDLIRKYPYSSNAGVFFEVTPRSYHFVTPVEGERHTLVMYLWGTGRNYDGSGIEIQPMKRT